MRDAQSRSRAVSPQLTAKSFSSKERRGKALYGDGDFKIHHAGHTRMTSDCFTGNRSRHRDGKSVRIAQVLSIGVRVDLRSPDVAVSQQLLHRTQIGTAAKQWEANEWRSVWTFALDARGDRNRP